MPSCNIWKPYFKLHIDYKDMKSSLRNSFSPSLGMGKPLGVVLIPPFFFLTQTFLSSFFILQGVSVSLNSLLAVCTTPLPYDYTIVSVVLKCMFT